MKERETQRQRKKETFICVFVWGKESHLGEIKEEIRVEMTTGYGTQVWKISHHFVELISFVPYHHSLHQYL